MAAAYLGWDSLPVELRYFDGGERVESGPLYPPKIGLGNPVNENFADGKKPGRKGLAKRSGVNCKASVTSLRKTAKNSSGEKQRMAHWCANMKSGRKKTNEGSEREGQLEEFIAWVFDKLYIPGELPTIKLSDEKEGNDQHRTGYYDLNKNYMWIYTGNRNTVEIMRTVAHELVHHKQRTQGDAVTDQNLVDIEGQADQTAGLLMKIYTKTHPEIIE
jgi:hypothetical protein